MACLYVKVHDEHGTELDPSELTEAGKREAVFQCQQLAEELATSSDTMDPEELPPA